jgi:imidazolonepropionase-like amidohydrolase
MLRPLAGGGTAARALALVAACAAFSPVPELAAQEPPTQTGEERPVRQGRRGRGMVFVRAGFVHPVSGPTIENGVVAIRGSRIAAVGKADEIEIPEGSTVLDYPDGHVYPGFVDALSAAFGGEVQQDGNVDAGAEIGEALDGFDEDSTELARHGITTAYVSNRSGAMWRGKGALIRPGTDGYTDFPDSEGVAVHMRLTTGPGASHPLQRIKQLEGFGKEFDQLEGYEKARDEHAVKLEEYQKKLDEYLAWHRKKNGKPEPEKAEGDKPAEGGKPAEGEENKPAEAPRPAPAEGGERRGGRGSGRGGPPRGGNGGETAGPTPPSGRPAPAAPQQGGEAKPDEAKDGDKAPERPKFPAEPAVDPAKEALIAVRDGELALFVEAHRKDEIERTAAIARERGIERVVIELATGAADAIDALADGGMSVILTTALSVEDTGQTGARFAPEGLENESVAHHLAARGLPFALASGSNDRGRFLPAIVAEAIGQGVPADIAVRAITLTPAEVLGVADRVGSIEPRKLADLVITSAPLGSSDARVVRVLSSGVTLKE